MRVKKLLKKLSDSTEIEVINQNANIIFKGQKHLYRWYENNFKIGRIEVRGSRLYIYEKVGETNAKEQICEHQQNRHISNEHFDG